MKTPKLSFVIPVFNGEKLLPRLIDSLAKQTYQNVEFVFVDDTSYDNTSLILQNFKRADNRVIYIRHESNQGTFVSRASGLKVCTGDYIAQVDADDRISENFAESVVSILQKEKADMCLAETIYVFPDGRQEKVPSCFREEDNGVIKNGEAFGRFFKTHSAITEDIYTWCKVISKKIYKQCAADIEAVVKDSKNPLNGGEDLIYTAMFALCSKKMVKCKDAFYYYYRHSEQSTCLNSISKYKSQYSSACKTLAYIKQYLEKRKIFDKYKDDYAGWQQTYNLIMQQDAFKLGCVDEYYKIAYEHKIIKKVSPREVSRRDCQRKFIKSMQ